MPNYKKTLTGITVGIFTSVLGSIVWDGIKGLPLLSTLDSISGSITNFFNLELKLWGVLVAIAIFIIALFLIAYFSSNKGEKTTSSPISSYRSDTIKAIDWQWGWYEYAGKWNLKDLVPVCPYDRTPLLLSRNFYSIINGECPRCSAKVTYSEEDFEKVKMIIVDNANKRIRRSNE